MFEQMMQSDPRFARFVHESRGKTPRQIAEEHGIDWDSVSRYL